MTHQASGTAGVDELHEGIAEFAHCFDLAQCGQNDVDRCRLHLLDTFLALIVGLDADCSRRARAVAPLAFDGPGASLFGTARRSSVEMAAFANATAARECELNDVYFAINGAGAHPSDVTMPLFAVAEAQGRTAGELISALLVAYEIYLNFSDHAKIVGFDQTLIAGLAVAVGAARLMGLPKAQLKEAVSLAVVPNNPLNQTRRNDLTMWKAMAAGQAGRAGVFAATLARAGICGPDRPFDGRMGLLSKVAERGEALGQFAPPGAPLRIHDVMIKPRAACAATISTILAGEKIAGDIADLRRVSDVKVEIYESAWAVVGSGEERWRPQSRESADHSIPYIVAATLADGTVGPQQFEPDRIFDETIRGLMAKVSVVPDAAFTRLNQLGRPEHHTRVTVTMDNGRTHVGVAGGENGDMQNSASREAVVDKFHRLCDPLIGRDRARVIIETVLTLRSDLPLYNIASLFVREEAW